MNPLTATLEPSIFWGSGRFPVGMAVVVGCIAVVRVSSELQ